MFQADVTRQSVSSNLDINDSIKIVCGFPNICFKQNLKLTFPTLLPLDGPQQNMS